MRIGLLDAEGYVVNLMAWAADRPVPETWGGLATYAEPCAIDGRVVNGVYSPPVVPEPEPPPVPASITRRQMLLQLALSEMITGQEALAAAQTGAVPAAVQAVFDQLEPADKLAAEITWATMSEADRGHPLVAALAATQAMTEADIDDFFRAAALL
jgi:hypothetical protein